MADETVETKPKAKNIHEAIINVMNEVGYVRKTKSAKLDYTFAGEAALIAALRPAMVENDIYMSVIRYEEIQREVYETRSGSKMNSTRAKAVVRFTHAPSGTYIDVEALGEGADSGDKSTNKCATGAYKYALRQTFCIETGDDPDKDPSAGQERASIRSAPSKAAQSSNGAQSKAPTQSGGRTEKEFIAWAKTKGVRAAEIGQALVAAGITEFNPDHWDDMEKAVLDFAMQRDLSS